MKTKVDPIKLTMDMVAIPSYSYIYKHRNLRKSRKHDLESVPEDDKYSAGKDEDCNIMLPVFAAQQEKQGRSHDKGRNSKSDLIKQHTIEDNNAADEVRIYDLKNGSA